MDFADNFKNKLFKVTDESFDEVALELFEYQYYNNSIYKKFCNSLKKNPKNVFSKTEIPFLPIQFFKNHTIKTGIWEEELIFKSSGTTSSYRSKHFIKSVDFYHQNTIEIFDRFFGSITDYQIVALLPSYQTQGDSSLISMVDHFMSKSNHKGQFMLESNAKSVLETEQKKILIGVSYALWDLSEQGITPKNATIIETGGMKGRRQELVRAELHSILKKGLDQDSIHSEYGMTELQSQAYGSNGHFQFPPWAEVLIRDTNDPFDYVESGKSGGINVIDLANVDSCSFIETEDLGRSRGQYFEVLGRFDNSEIRGCNLMI